MAKPGSDGARRIAQAGQARAVDLTLASMTPEETAAAQEAIEEKFGMRCGGCGRRITVGFRFTSIAPREQSPVLRLAACSRDECDFAEQCRDGATVMEMVEFAWLDDAGKDARPAPTIVARAEARARAVEWARMVDARKDAAAPQS